MLVPILSPLFASAFRHAEELSQAMESRCYHGSEGRTKVRMLKMGKADYVGFALTAVMVVLLIVTRMNVAGIVTHFA